MTALDVGMYDNFVSNTLQSEMSDLRVLDDNEVELVNGQLLPLLALTIAPGAGTVVFYGGCVVVTSVAVGFGMGYWVNRDPQPPPPPRPPLPGSTFWELNMAVHNDWLSPLP